MPGDRGHIVKEDASSIGPRTEDMVIKEAAEQRMQYLIARLLWNTVVKDSTLLEWNGTLLQVPFIVDPEGHRTLLQK
jgi:hypothetical protein